MAERAAPRRGLTALTVALIAIQVYALYVPSAPGPPLFAGADKLGHLALFAAPVTTAILAGADRGKVVAVALIQALVSEGFQHLFLPGRSGDPLDVVADAVGVGLGLWVAFVVKGRLARR